MIEQHFSVQRTARYYVLGDLRTAREIWIVCHGYAQLARYFARPFESIVEPARAVVAPEALNRYYFETAPGVHAADARVAATWMTREHRDAEIGDYVLYLDALAAALREQAPHARFTALGFSQGAQTVSRWAVLGNTALARVILWGAAPAHDLDPAPDAFRGAELIIAAGTSDPYFNPARAGVETLRLQTAGLTSRVFAYTGEHRIDAEALRALIAFLHR